MKLSKVLSKLDSPLTTPEIPTETCYFCHKKYIVESMLEGHDFSDPSICYTYGCAAWADEKTVCGEYGSTVCDDETLYWVNPPMKKGMICDKCISEFIKNGSLSRDPVYNCDICKKIFYNTGYARRGSLITYFGVFGEEKNMYWPYGDKYSNNDSIEFKWCCHCMDSRKPFLTEEDFIFERMNHTIIDREKDIKKKTKYIQIWNQMKLKKQLMKDIKKDIK